MAVSFKVGDWVLGGDCAKCRRRTPILRDMMRVNAIGLPVTGRFHFACEHCGSDNFAHSDDLKRYQIEEDPRKVAAAI